MTTSGGTPRPTPAEAQDAPTQVSGPAVGGGTVPREAPRPASDPQATAQHASPSNGAGAVGERSSGGYDVAAALRAQATRAAQATRHAAQRVQDAMAPTPITEGDTERGASNGAAQPPPAASPSSSPAQSSTQSSARSSPPSPSSPSSGGRTATAVATPAAAASSAAPAQAYATGPGPATTARPAARPPETGSEPARSRETTGTSAAPAPAPRRTGRVRKARLRLLRLDPWSVMKTAFLLSVAMGIMLFVAVAVLWSVLDAAGVFSAVGDVVRDVTASETSAGIDVEGFVAMSRVLGFTTLVAVVDVVLITALATLGAFLYNLSASLLGGLEVTLAEDD